MNTPDAKYGFYCSFAIIKSEISLLRKLSACAVICFVFSPARMKAGWATSPTCSPGIWDEMIVTLFSVTRDYWLPSAGPFLFRTFRWSFVNTAVDICCVVVLYHGLCRKEGHGHSTTLLGDDLLTVWLAVAVWISDIWQVTGDTGHLKPDTWHLTPDTGHLTPDTYNLTPDNWHLIPFFPLF